MTDTDPKPKTAFIGAYPVPAETMERLAAQQRAIRDAGHKPPSKGLLLSALIYVAPLDGEELEANSLKPYRDDHPSEDQPD